MNATYFPADPISALAYVWLLSWATSVAKPADQTAAAIAHAPASAATVSRIKGGPVPGDMTAYRRIASDAATLLNRGDLPGARTRIRDLELAWSADKFGLKITPNDWRVLDRAIDHALKALQSQPPLQADCQAAMADLLKAFDTLRVRS